MQPRWVRWLFRKSVDAFARGGSRMARAADFIAPRSNAFAALSRACNRLQFSRRSEKIQRQIEQLELQLEGLEAASAEERQHTQKKTLPQVTVFTEAARKPARRILPEHL